MKNIKSVTIEYEDEILRLEGEAARFWMTDNGIRGVGNSQWGWVRTPKVGTGIS